MLWSIGKDCNVMLWLARKAFFGHVPFPLVHVDTGIKFPRCTRSATAASRSGSSTSWARTARRSRRRTRPCRPPPARRRARPLGLKNADRQARLQRPDRSASAATRRRPAPRSAIFSPRGEDSSWNFSDQPPEFWDQFKTDFPPGTHLRVHPLLHWTELDIWRYTKRENIPIVDLYFAKNGKRYRSLGDKDITFPIEHAATLDEIIDELETTKVPERAGRAMDHETEDAFERLRAAGYM